jgi:hypothetical protein
MATSRVCSIPGCDKPFEARDLCNGHYERWRKHGSAFDRSPLRPLAANGEGLAFINWALDVINTDECVLWPFSVSGGGYSMVRWNGRQTTGHRLLCELAHGPAPSPDHEAAHNCGVRRCVSPHHVRWATSKENIGDQIAHGTRARGEKQGNSRLTSDDVRTIRELDKKGVPRRILAEEFGVKTSCIQDVCNWRSWKHLL